MRARRVFCRSTGQALLVVRFHRERRDRAATVDRVSARFEHRSMPLAVRWKDFHSRAARRTEANSVQAASAQTQTMRKQKPATDYTDKSGFYPWLVFS